MSHISKVNSLEEFVIRQVKGNWSRSARSITRIALSKGHTTYYEYVIGMVTVFREYCSYKNNYEELEYDTNDSGVSQQLMPTITTFLSYIRENPGCQKVHFEVIGSWTRGKIYGILNALVYLGLIIEGREGQRSYFYPRQPTKGAAEGEDSSVEDESVLSVEDAIKIIDGLN